MTDRKIAFPEIKNFSELFEAVETDKANAPEPVRFQTADWQFFGKMPHDKAPKKTVEIGPYCSVSPSHRSLYVHPVKAVRDYLEQNWVGDSNGSFKVIVRTDGTALVTAEYSRILGSHWLALVDVATVPVPKE
jgi:hypothetical protein